MGPKNSMMITLILGVTALLMTCDGEVSIRFASTNRPITCNTAIFDDQKFTEGWSCPIPKANIYCFACIDTCQADNDCGALKKCCYQPGCGNWCLYAVHGGVNPSVFPFGRKEMKNLTDLGVKDYDDFEP